MRITLDLPEDIAAHLAAQGENLSRAALEAFALEEYRARKLSTAQLRQLTVVDREEWAHEVDDQAEFLGKFGERVPQDLRGQHEALRTRVTPVRA